MTARQRPCLTVLLLALASAPAAQASWTCWGPDAPDPCRNTLNSVAPMPGSGERELWAAGARGTILRSNGATWQRTTSGTSSDLLDILMVGADLGWAVGVDGAMVQWNGARWYLVPPVTSSWIRAVEVVPGAGPVRAWAAADKYGVGQFLYYDGSRWDVRQQGQTHTFPGTVYALSMVNADDGWAVGTKLGDLGSGLTTIGQILRWNGARWEGVVETPERLRAVHLMAPDDGWAVGDAGAILRWDGAAWRRLDPVTDRPLFGVVAVSPTEAWAVGGDGVLLRWDGSTWGLVPGPASGYEFRAVTCAGGSAAVAVGQGGVIARWDSDRWRSEVTPPMSRIERVAMAPGGDGSDLWAAGSGSNLLHWDGRRWSAVPSPGQSYLGLSMLSGGEGWVGGRRTFAHWDGWRWNETAAPASATDLVMVAPNDGWAVGWGTIQHWDGVSWSSVASPTTSTYQGVAAADVDAVWAVGYSGTIARYDGAAWGLWAPAENLSLRAVSMVSRQVGFIVGTYAGVNGVMLEWNGSGWRNLDLPSSTPNLHGVDVRRFGADMAGWAVGATGHTMVLSQGGWHAISSPTANDLLDVAVVSPGEAWAVGENGVILRWSNTPAPSLPAGTVVTAAARLAGQGGTDWKTDLVVTNLGAGTASVELAAWLRDRPNLDPPRATEVLGTMASLSVEDALGTLFNLADGAAASLFLASASPLAVASRTYNLTPEGTYGQSIPAAAVASAFAPGQVAVLIGLVENPSYRSNLGLVNTSDRPVTVRAVFRDDSGEQLGTRIYEILERSSLQRTRVLRDVTSSRVDLAWVELTGSGGDFLAYASTVDAQTGDPVYQPARAASAVFTDVVLQGLAKVGGAAGTSWSSSLVLTNTSGRTASVTLDLLVRGQVTANPQRVSVSLAPGEARVVDDALQSLFALSSGAGSLAVRAAPGILVNGRTFNRTSRGTFGQYIPSQDAASAVTTSRRGVLVGLVQNDRFRSNLGITNASSVGAELTLTMLDRHGAQVGGSRPLWLDAGEVRQLDRVATMFTADAVDSATVIVTLTSGAAVQVFLSVVDSRTGDPVFQTPTTM